MAGEMKEYLCDICGFQCTEESHLRSHNVKHSDVRIEVCPLCNRTFKLKAHLTMHIKQHICKICGLTVSHEMEQHLIQHKSTLPTIKTAATSRLQFDCAICSKKYMYKHSWKNHMATHLQNKRTANTHKCMYCVKSYKYSSELRRHLKKHLTIWDWHCPICNKSFPWESSFKAHLKVHLALKQYSCGHCLKEFTKKSSLELHIFKEHFGDEPSVLCDLCPKLMYSPYQLKRHVSNVHCNETRGCSMSATSTTNIRLWRQSQSMRFIT